MVIPKINSELLKEGENTITPIIMKGDAKEMDEKFIDTISQPLFKFNETALSIAQLEKDIESIKETAKKNAKSEKTKNTKASKAKSTDKPKTDVAKTDTKKIDNDKQEIPEKNESNDESKESPADKRSEERKQVLIELGLVFREDKWIKDEIYISPKEIDMLSDEAWNTFLETAKKSLEKVEIPAGAQQVNAFDGNATNVGVKDINKEKKVSAPTDTLKASKKDSSFNPFEEDDQEEAAKVGAEAHKENVESKPEAKEETPKEDGEMSFF
jgi:hypothetical protein